MKPASIAATVAILSFAATAHAQTNDEFAEPEFPDATSAEEEAGLVAVPDRPTFSTAPFAVPAGHAQLEAGAEFATDGEAGSTLGFPVLVRIGVADSFEVRAGLPAPSIGFGEATASDLGALQLGAKIAGSVNDTLSLGVMPFFDIASNSGESTIFSQSSLGAFFLWGLQFGDFGLSGNLGLTVGPGASPEAGPREFFYAASLAPSYTLGSLGITLEGFTEVSQYGNPDIGTQLALGYALTDVLVVDLYGGTGLAGNTPDAWVGLGATFAK